MYRMPAEWEPHVGVIMHYPHMVANWRGYPPHNPCVYSRKAFRDVARAIAQKGKEDVHMFCNSQADADRLRRNLDAEAEEPVEGEHPILIHVAESDDSWIRDTGPTFVFNTILPHGAPMIGVDWAMNAYGGPNGCYWPAEKDSAIAKTITETLSKYYKPNPTMESLPRKDIVMEGGAIHVDGEGTILTTEECVLNPNRNPQMSREQIEDILKAQLGGTKVIWLKRGLYMDHDTNGHIDNIACFIKPGHVLLAWPHDESDTEQLERSVEAENILKASTDAQGRQFTIEKVACPSPLYYTQEEVDGLTPRPDVPPRKVGERMAASYANFYISNGAIILPGFDQPESDDNAVKVLEGLFPDRQIVLISSREILLGGGNVHCITQQIPYSPLAE